MLDKFVVQASLNQRSSFGIAKCGEIERKGQKLFNRPRLQDCKVKSMETVNESA